MAFSNIESDEMLKVFDIAVVDNDEFRNDEVYVKTLDALSSDGGDKLFNIKYTDKDDADILLEDGEIEGYIYFSSNKPNVVIRKNGMNQTVLRYVVNEIEQNKIIYDRIIKRNKRDRATSLMYGLSVVYEYEREGKADLYRNNVDEETYLMKYVF